MAKNSYREEMAEMFVAALEEDPYTFIKGWNFAGTGSPINAASSNRYNGINKLYLKYMENRLGYGDNRWMTFNQIRKAGYHLQKGAKGVKVEYWLPFDEKTKKWVSWDDYAKAEKSEEINPYTLRQKLYTVFNGTMIEGLPEIERLKLNEINEEEVVTRVAKGLGVKINESYNSNAAYYSPYDDEITVPVRGQFKSQQDYARTCLHELGHSTGHKSRLDRDQTGTFGTEKYAYEELIAEISSCFMGEYIEDPVTDHILDNHKAYIQSWASAIKEDKSFLFNAIKEADKASDYMVEKAHLEELLEERAHKEKSLDVAKRLINEYTKEEFFDTEADFSDLENIGLAYTTYEENADIEIQVSADLVNYRIDTYVNHELYDYRKYETLDELIEKELECLSWSELVSQPLSDVYEKSEQEGDFTTMHTIEELETEDEEFSFSKDDEEFEY